MSIQEMKERLAELREDNAMAAMWRTDDIERLVALVDAAHAVSAEAMESGYQQARVGRQLRDAIEEVMW